MEFSSVTRHVRLLTACFAIAIAMLCVLAGKASAAEMAKVKIEVSSAQASAGSVALTNNEQSASYGTCAAPASPGSNACTIEVPVKSGVLLVTQPASGEAAGVWSGACKTVVGQVCHVQTAGSGSTKSAAVTLVAAATPAITTSAAHTFGQAPNECGAPPPTLSATGAGFPANTPVTLSDDGTEVASGTTGEHGEATLSYLPTGEPGVYRTLTMTAGGKSASTDVYNGGHLCVVANFPEPEKDSITVDASDLDAGSSNNFVTVKGVKTPITANASGSGSATTQVFSCPKGKSVPYKISGTRGTGSQKYSYSVSLTLTC